MDKTISNLFIHPLAVCESSDIGDGCRIYAFAHIMEGATVGTHCSIGDHVFLEGGAAVGDRVTIKNQVMIWDGVVIEDDVFIGPGVIFTNDRLPRSPRSELPQIKKRYTTKSWLQKTRVCRGASIGAGAVLGPGINVGDYAMVGMGSVVTRNLAPHQLVIGNPAQAAGWVCQCGERLPAKADAAGYFKCPLCSMTFKEKNAGGSIQLVNFPY